MGTLTNQMTGRVTGITNAGNLVTDLDSEQLAAVPRDESLVIHFDGHETMGLFPDDHDQPVGTLVAKLNADGVLEIEIVGLSVAELLGIPVDTPVVLTW